MLRILFTTAFFVSAVGLLAVAVKSDDVSARARKLHFASIVVDTHDDTTQLLLDPSFDISARHMHGNVDVPRMREGGLSALFFSIYISGKTTGPPAVKQAIDQIDAVREAVRTHPNDFVLATSADEIRGAKNQNKIAALIGVEGGHMIGNDLAVLRIFAALGVRYMTLTHMVNTEWADSSTDAPAHNGLTDFGKDVVREMNRLGIIVDISHVSDKTFYDVLATTKAPVIASHSSCRAICSASRNMTDDMLRALAQNGGVVQINYHVSFLSQEFQDYETAHKEVLEALNAEVQKRCGKDSACADLIGQEVVRDFMREGQLPKVEWTAIVDHIDHAVKIAGVDHVGLGSDFDGAGMPLGMEDASHLPQITDALLKKGYSEGDVKKILGENTLRAMAEVERVSRELSKQSRK